MQVALTDTGRRPGTDVVQLYVHDPAAAHEPPDQLKGFRGVSLPPGQTRTVRFAVDPRDLAHWDTAARRWVVSPGTYQIRLGDSSRHLPLRLSFTVAHAMALGRPTPPAPPAVAPQASAAADASCGKDVVGPLANGAASVPNDAVSPTGRPAPF